MLPFPAAAARIRRSRALGDDGQKPVCVFLDPVDRQCGRLLCNRQRRADGGFFRAVDRFVVAALFFRC